MREQKSQVKCGQIGKSLKFQIKDFEYDFKRELKRHYRHFLFKKLCSIYLVTLGPCCCMQDFSSCSEQGLLLVAVHQLLGVVASLVEHRPQVHMGSVVVQFQLPCSMGPGIKPVSPALAGRFLSTVPPGKFSLFFLNVVLVCLFFFFFLGGGTSQLVGSQFPDQGLNPEPWQ